MTQLHQIYKCQVCGNIVEVVYSGAGELVCCGQPMELQVENIVNESSKKHVPVIEELPANVCRVKDGVIVKIGEIEHPMTLEHYIEWVEIIIGDGRRGRKFLSPGDKPNVEFHTRAKVIGARAYCNLHGLWKS
ncbi:desulfoferrodoxin [Candidatus Kuenenbacteria bacterium CG1_02_38_13]|uniref:Desulfoferrodoxin n=1 Tax=Candidatus Kuenenbacteria bacterium CG1_02_38_13 TaxID=1805235 RepID=A0A1J4TZ79_9BACT|nr:MAG: desulfoferrodoxin [Candidatus Kuenenbacteria bacterium CG1_02_38_13]